MSPDLPDAGRPIADKGDDGDRVRKALTDIEIIPCIPGRRARRRSSPTPDSPKRRHRIERRVGRLKDGRRIPTRHHRCAHPFMSAISSAATVISQG